MGWQISLKNCPYRDILVEKREFMICESLDFIIHIGSTLLISGEWYKRANFAKMLQTYPLGETKLIFRFTGELYDKLGSVGRGKM